MANITTKPLFSGQFAADDVLYLATPSDSAAPDKRVEARKFLPIYIQQSSGTLNLLNYANSITVDCVYVGDPSPTLTLSGALPVGCVAVFSVQGDFSQVMISGFAGGTARAVRPGEMLLGISDGHALYPAYLPEVREGGAIDFNLREILTGRATHATASSTSIIDPSAIPDEAGSIVKNTSLTDDAFAASGVALGDAADPKAAFYTAVTHNGTNAFLQLFAVGASGGDPFQLLSINLTNGAELAAPVYVPWVGGGAGRTLTVNNFGQIIPVLNEPGVIVHMSAADYTSTWYKIGQIADFQAGTPEQWMAEFSIATAYQSIAFRVAWAQGTDAQISVLSNACTPSAASVISGIRVVEKSLYIQKTGDTIAAGKLGVSMSLYQVRYGRVYTALADVWQWSMGVTSAPAAGIDYALGETQQFGSTGRLSAGGETWGAPDLVPQEYPVSVGGNAVIHEAGTIKVLEAFAAPMYANSALGADLDDLFVIGTHTILGSSTNAPTGGSDWVVTVAYLNTPGGGSWQQIARNFSGSHIWVRVWSGSSWGAWLLSGEVLTGGAAITTEAALNAAPTTTHAVSVAQTAISAAPSGLSSGYGILTTYYVAGPRAFQIFGTTDGVRQYIRGADYSSGSFSTWTAWKELGGGGSSSGAQSESYAIGRSVVVSPGSTYYVGVAGSADPSDGTGATWTPVSLIYPPAAGYTAVSARITYYSVNQATAMAYLEYSDNGTSWTNTTPSGVQLTAYAGASSSGLRHGYLLSQNTAPATAARMWRIRISVSNNSTGDIVAGTILFYNP